MKREEKNAITRRRIFDAALREFSQKGYDAASVSAVCAENDISKGIIYHYFKDKDDLYLCCVSECFSRLTDRLREETGSASGSAERRLREYFDARVRFFASYPLYLGIFLSAVLSPPEQLADRIASLRSDFDGLSVQLMRDMLKGVVLRPGLSIDSVVEDFRMYMDYFNARFKTLLSEAPDPQQAMKRHEEMCQRQISILLYGVTEAQNERN